MMNVERAQFMGQREELKNTASRLKAGIEGLRQSIRTILNPFVDIEDIDAVTLHAQAYELAEKVQKYKEIMLKIRRISKELGDR